MRRRPAIVVAAAAAALSLAACSATGGRKAVEEAAAAGGKPAKTMTVTLITHSAPGDDFWDLVRKGADDAADKDGITLEYQASPDGAEQANLVQAAIDKKVDGIAVTLSKPDQVGPAVTKAVAAGIPVTALNGGVDAWKALGVKGFFGQEDRVAGQVTGERLKGLGAKKVLCILHEQGNVGNDARCTGVKAALPTTETLYVNGADTADVQSKLTGKLQQDEAIDWVLGLKASVALTGVQSVKEAGSAAKVATFDTNAELIKAIKAGDVQFAVDQQPYLQGYLAVDALWLYKTNGNDVGGGQATLTGPAFVDKTNVAAIEKFAAAGKR
ncbi:substrate-binding domain-containing protein [Arsenicicoccus dermatophilus]|uniref:substrate-binding domain-containing protein n=1 Tax=Arsenicicoccus dermatophilus TaxID=1076331 RepID=UPI001F4C6C0E|nr:substrate-binding domain-containing protein [Arsenicicoccus dermatophilus]MCH8614123.1 substrate-binding domain-containing protein [Arsenicicoccus dermatophilus]